MSEPLTVVVTDRVTVDGDEFKVMVTVTRPSQPNTVRDMAVIQSEVARLLPAWIRDKIQAGEPESP